MTNAIQPHALPSALDGYPGLRVLSLDCFDTLLWRDCHAPVDLFARLPGTTTLQRRSAESRARTVAEYGHDRFEVSIDEIYAHLLPNAAPADRQAAIAAELAVEGEHCYAFAPTVALMRNAKARGLQVIVVSDTYFDPAQLRDLIAQAAGADVAGLIDRIFCSSTFGKPKARGLFGDVLRKLAAQPHEILHIGDNPIADVAGVAPFGVNTLHLEQFSAVAEERFRHEAAVSAMFHVATTDETAAQLPHRAALALAEPLAVDPAEALGLTVMGPVFHGFQRWLEAEAAELEAKCSGRLHWLFVMRDGYLPKLVHEVSGKTGHAVEISRFTATAASMRDEADPLRYIELELGSLPRTLARQVLMPEADIDRVIADRSPSDASFALLNEMRKGARRKSTLAATRALAKRLVAHVRAVVNPAPGDTLMLIDLGYNGSVQNCIDDLLRAELGVRIAGRYLILREMDRPGLDKRGFIDGEHYDEPTLQTMCSNVALFEQVCTTAIGSVVDYEENGTPIRMAIDIKGGQSAVREAIQAGCLRFAEAQREAVIRAATTDEVALWRKGVAAVLGRMMYLPMTHELAVVERFHHDANLGTERTVALFDPAFAERGLRQRGLFYVNGAERMYLPAELKGHGLAPKLTLLANRRFGLPFRFSDFTDRSVSLPVIYVAGEELVQQAVEARATHDGYYLAAVPIGDCRFSVAVQLGAEYEYVQVDSINAVPVASFLDDHIREEDPQIPITAIAEGMEQLSSDLYRCADTGGFLMIHPPERVDDTPMMVALVFRPIAAWPSANAQAADPDAPALDVAA